MSRAYLGLGSNVGDRQAHLCRALQLISRLGEITSISPVYESEPAGFLEQPRFLNAACALTTRQGPQELLGSLKRCESEAGRTPTFLNGPREIDIDILLYDRLVMETPELTIPHPRLTERAFALIPLSRIAPGKVHPVLGKTIRDLAGNIDRTGIKRSGLTIYRPGGTCHV